jgi:hypothetical protein
VSGLAFTASVLHSLAWPAAAVVIAVMLRKPITAVLNRGVRRLRAGPVEVEFDQGLAEVDAEVRRIPELTEPAGAPQRGGSLADELATAAEVSPEAAVVAAFSRIERRLAEILDGAAVSRDRVVSARALARLAREHDLINDETLAAVDGLAVLRNLAAHPSSTGATIGADRARDFLVLADAVLYALRVKAR